MSVAARSAADSLADRLDAISADVLAAELDAQGYATLPRLLAQSECAEVSALYADQTRFRRRVVMARHAYGRGEYQYFAYPLPACVAALRDALYGRLVGIANRWSEALGSDVRYPGRLDEFLARCHAAGQERPTPLVLDYGPGDYNRLHQDRYGEHLFPIQATILLSQPDEEFTGGEFVLTEQRARMQSRVEVVPLARGDAVVFAVDRRPLSGARRMSRAVMRHGVSPIRSGHRRTLGIIFHDAA